MDKLSDTNTVRMVNIYSYVYIGVRSLKQIVMKFHLTIAGRKLCDQPKQIMYYFYDCILIFKLRH